MRKDDTHSAPTISHLIFHTTHLTSSSSLLHTTSRGSSGPRVCTHPCTKSSSHYSLSISRSSCCSSTSTMISSNTVYSAIKEMGSTDESYSHTGHEPKDCFFTETYAEFNQESVTEQAFPEQRFSEDVDYDDAAIGQMLFNAYRGQVDHSEREGLSSGLSSSSMSQDGTICCEQ